MVAPSGLLLLVLSRPCCVYRRESADVHENKTTLAMPEDTTFVLQGWQYLNKSELVVLNRVAPLESVEKTVLSLWPCSLTSRTMSRASLKGSSGTC